MKKIFLFTVLVIFTLNINAQGEDETNNDSNYGWSKGDMYISGSVGLWSQKFGEEKENQFNIMPQFGMLVTDHIAVGAQVGYMSYKSEFDGTTTDESNTFMIGAYGKWLCMPENRFTPYLGVGLNYLSENDKQNDVKYSGIDVGAGAGIIYGLNEHFYLGANYALLSYSTLKADTDGAESLNTFNIGLDWKQLNFSLAYRF
jgi:outer membrane protein